MTLLLGVGLLALAALIMSWAIGAFLRPDAARWTRNEAVSVAISLVVTTLLAFGLGFLAMALVTIGTLVSVMGALDALVVVAMAILTGLASARLSAPARRGRRPAGEIVPLPPRAPLVPGGASAHRTA